MKFLITNNTQRLQEIGPVDLGVSSFSEEGILFLYEKESVPQVVNGTYYFIDGYLRDLSRAVNDTEGQKESVVAEITQNWPLSPNITGSFSASLLDLKRQKIILCTDQIGLYPLYYLKQGTSWYISNSIILMGSVSDAEFDAAGIVQRSVGPAYANLGSRTILKECKRLLPGECLRFDLEGNLLSKEYDNRLYQEMSSSSQEHSLQKEYWKAYRREVEYCVNYSKQVNIALSGGIDSRIALGAIPEGKEVNCYTFGSPDNYESGIAKKLARLKNAEFHSCYDPNCYFPSPDVFRKYVQETEALELCSWLEITESVDKKKKEPLLVGELCEALPARNIKSFSGKNFRKENFFKFYVLDKDYSFTKADNTHFEKWKEKMLHQFRIYYIDRHLQKFDFKVDQDELLRALSSDLNELFSRIEAHQLPYVELYDELFSWYTYTRMHLAKHLLVTASRFDTYSPAMSLQMLTKTSQLHPNIRLNYRFAKKLFKNNRELRQYRKIPTAQAPLVPQYFPDLFKFAMWGVRSTADQFLIKRMVKTKEVERRYRLFKSINWASVYQHPDMEKNLKTYFKRNHLGKKFFDDMFTQAVQRKELKQWPFANLNLINAASLNQEIDLIMEKRSI